LDARNNDWNNKEIVLLNHYPLLTAKPVVYLVNITKQNMEKMQVAFHNTRTVTCNILVTTELFNITPISSQNKWFKDIQEWVAKESPGDPVSVTPCNTRAVTLEHHNRYSRTPQPLLSNTRTATLEHHNCNLHTP
jgi:hypothetical protein